MQSITTRSLAVSLTVYALAALLAACSDATPLEPGSAGPGTGTPVKPLSVEKRIELPDQQDMDPLVTIRRSTARYHHLRAALEDGFTFLHPCEVRPDGNVGVVYINFARLLDGKVDPKLPDALVYEQDKNGRLTLAAAEFAVLNTGQAAPEFLGHTFQEEAEFGVFGLHVWLWKRNPNGLFAEGNPGVSCVDPDATGARGS
jgi:hypothetical protein